MILAEELDRGHQLQGGQVHVQVDGGDQRRERL